MVNVRTNLLFKDFLYKFLHIFFLLVNLQNCSSREVEVGVEYPLNAPLFNDLEGFHCKPRKNFVFGDSLQPDCSPRDEFYFLRTVIVNKVRDNCNKLAEEYLQKYGFLNEMASFPIDYTEKRFFNNKDIRFQKNLCALGKMKNKGEFNLSQSGVLACCEYDKKNDQCRSLVFSFSQDLCLCALYIKTNPDTYSMRIEEARKKCELNQ